MWFKPNLDWKLHCPELIAYQVWFWFILWSWKGLISLITNGQQKTHWKVEKKEKEKRINCMVYTHAIRHIDIALLHRADHLENAYLFPTVVPLSLPVKKIILFFSYILWTANRLQNTQDYTLILQNTITDPFNECWLSYAFHSKFIKPAEL